VGHDTRLSVENLLCSWAEHEEDEAEVAAELGLYATHLQRLRNSDSPVAKAIEERVISPYAYWCGLAHSLPFVISPPPSSRALQLRPRRSATSFRTCSCTVACATGSRTTASRSSSTCSSTRATPIRRCIFRRDQRDARGVQRR
jgi:hypothetical protein